MVFIYRIQLKKADKSRYETIKEFINTNSNTSEQQAISALQKLKLKSNETARVVVVYPQTERENIQNNKNAFDYEILKYYGKKKR